MAFRKSMEWSPVRSAVSTVSAVEGIGSKRVVDAKGAGAKAEDVHSRKVCLCSYSIAMALQNQFWNYDSRARSVVVTW